MYAKGPKTDHAMCHVLQQRPRTMDRETCLPQSVCFMQVSSSARFLPPQSTPLSDSAAG